MESFLLVLWFCQSHRLLVSVICVTKLLWFLVRSSVLLLVRIGTFRTDQWANLGGTKNEKTNACVTIVSFLDRVTLGTASLQ